MWHAPRLAIPANTVSYREVGIAVNNFMWSLLYQIFIIKL
jgi:hypothetical protein